MTEAVTMPVLCASAKPMEAPNKAEVVGNGPENNMVTQALAIVEKKVRNLEKRKVRIMFSFSKREHSLTIDLVRNTFVQFNQFNQGNFY